jgi:hypothetical protein
LAFLIAVLDQTATGANRQWSLYADFTVDFRGAIRWLALLKFTHIIQKTMTPNQTIEVLGAGPGHPDDPSESTSEDFI